MKLISCAYLFLIALILTPQLSVIFPDLNIQAEELISDSVIELPGEYLIKYENEQLKENYENSGISESTNINSELKSEDIHLWSKATIKSLKEYNQLLNNSDVVSIQPEIEYKLQLTPDDAYYSSLGTYITGQYDQWNLRKIGLTPVETPSSGLSGWEINTGSSETIIAIVDSGIDLAHPDLINKLWINDLEQSGTPGVDDDLNGYVDDINGYNFIEDNTNIQEVLAHGSYTSGIAAASTNNNIGIAGICWECRIMVGKVFASANSTSDIYIAEAINYAVDNGAQIINLSLAGFGYSEIMEEAINYAVQNNVIVIAASGNDSVDSSFVSPAGLRNVITVNSTNYNDNFSDGFSNFGLKTDLAAPGASVLTTRLSSSGGCVGAVKYGCVSGTSLSAPHVSGVAALLYDHHKDDVAPWDYYDYRKVLLKSANDKGVFGFDELYGFGRVNALNALTMNDSLLSTETPTATLNAPTSNLMGSIINLSGSVDSSDLYAYYLKFTYKNPVVTLYMYTGRQNVSNSTLIDENLGLPDGEYTVSLIAEDFNGNTSAPSNIDIEVDTTSPSAFNLVSPTNWINSNLPVFTWQFSTDENGPVSYDLYIDDVLTYPNLSVHSYTAQSPFSDGSRQWKVRAKDSIGNFTESNTAELKIDTVAPNTFAVESSSVGSKASLSFSTTDAISGISRYDISINNGAFTTGTSPYTTPSLGSGTHTAKIRAYDNAGNYTEVLKSFEIDGIVFYLKTKGDLNADTQVNLSDLSILATYWNQNNNTADINQDGVVNISDLSILAGNWQKSF